MNNGNTVYKSCESYKKRVCGFAFTVPISLPNHVWLYRYNLKNPVNSSFNSNNRKLENNEKMTKIYAQCFQMINVIMLRF